MRHTSRGHDLDGGSEPYNCRRKARLWVWILYCRYGSLAMPRVSFFVFTLAFPFACDEPIIEAEQWTIQREAAFTASIKRFFACCGLTNQSVDQIR